MTEKAWPADWTFAVEERSAGVYEIRARAPDGREIRMTGTDPAELIERCRHAARKLAAKK